MTLKLGHGWGVLVAELASHILSIVEIPKRELPSLVGCGAKPCEKGGRIKQGLPCAHIAVGRLLKAVKRLLPPTVTLR
jgi:hypothetical protein